MKRIRCRSVVALDKMDLKLRASSLSAIEQRQILHDKQREFAKSDLFYLVYDILGYRDLNRSFHLPLCNTLTEFKDWEQLHLHPRGHFKSTIITIGENIQDILNNPNIRILLVNAVVGKSKAFLKEIQAHFVNNPVFAKLFPEHVPEKMGDRGTKEEFTTAARTKFHIRESTIEVTGIDKAVVSSHYDKIVFDDIVSKLNIGTKEYRSKVEEAYQEYLSLLDPPGRVRLVGTRWHHDDMYGRLMKRLKEWAEEATRESKASTKSAPSTFSGLEDSMGIKIFKTSAYLEDGQPSFPERFSLPYLRKLERKQGKRIHSAQYRNQPIGDADRMFDTSFMRYCKKAAPPKDSVLMVYSSCDPALSEKEKDDPTAIMTVRVDCDSNIFITRMELGMWNPDEVIDNCIRVGHKDNPTKFGFEVVAFQKALKFFLDKRIKEHNRYIRIEEIKRNTQINKSTRISRIQPYLAQGKIWIELGDGDPNDPPAIVKTFLEQLDEFPYSANDDLLDCLADCIEIMSLPSTPRKKEIVYSRITTGSPYHTGRGYRKCIA